MSDDANTQVVSSNDLTETSANFTPEDLLGKVAGYWTEDAMRTAKPIDMQLREPPVTMLSQSVWSQSGVPTVFESQAPDDEAIEEHFRHEYYLRMEDFKTDYVSDRTSFPYCPVGKLFMGFNGSNFVGTAWTIAENAVFTAGHCVYNGKKWADNILFVPQFDNGNAPVGRWTAKRIWSLKGWTGDSPDYKYDLAVFEVDRPIRPSTGSLGWMANFPPNQGPYWSIGYPVSSSENLHLLSRGRRRLGVHISSLTKGIYNFDGENMWQSVGCYINGTNPIKMHNNMTGGCSGGPWVVAKHDAAYANGLNSFRYKGKPNFMYSPYFGEGFINLYNVVKDIKENNVKRALDAGFTVEQIKEFPHLACKETFEATLEAGFTVEEMKKYPFLVSPLVKEHIKKKEEKDSKK